LSLIVSSRVNGKMATDFGEAVLFTMNLLICTFGELQLARTRQQMRTENTCLRKKTIAGESCNYLKYNQYITYCAVFGGLFNKNGKLFSLDAKRVGFFLEGCPKPRCFYCRFMQAKSNFVDILHGK
jgi:hypothetical protein